jgi:hypothetical protein
VYQQSLQDIVSSSQMDSPHAAGFVQVRKNSSRSVRCAFSAFAAEWFLLWRATAFAISSEESLWWFSECKTSLIGLVFVAMVGLALHSDLDWHTSAAG